MSLQLWYGYRDFKVKYSYTMPHSALHSASTPVTNFNQSPTPNVSLEFIDLTSYAGKRNPT